MTLNPFKYWLTKGIVTLYIFSKFLKKARVNTKGRINTSRSGRIHFFRGKTLFIFLSLGLIGFQNNDTQYFLV